MLPVEASMTAITPSSPTVRSRSIAPAVAGLLLCLGVALTAGLIQDAERRWLGRAWLENVALAIVLGALVRLFWAPDVEVRRGIRFAAKILLEVAVVLLGASMSAQVLLAAGPAMLLIIAALVVVAILSSYGIGRALRLPHRLAVLVACGNSICGNSAIAAVAPAIDADGDDVAASIALTAVLGVATVLILPIVWQALHLSALQFGALAGLTVYAVPQVLAAAAPAGPAAVQMGALVKLARVLMLGPVTFAAAALTRRTGEDGKVAGAGGLKLGHAAPWFIIGFVALMAVRSAGVLPDAWAGAASGVANLLTVVSMAALGLETDLRSVMRSGARVGAAATLSLVVLGAMALAVVHWRLGQ
jgi:uncharacterized integral membrane protein (TIGR00698 family)